MSVEQIQKIFDENPIAWGKYYCSEHFRMKSADFHLRIMLACTQNQKVAIQAPRGSAKSTIASFLYSTHQICNKRKRFILIAQNTFSKSSGTLDNIKEEIRGNQLINSDYSIKIVRDREGDSIFEHPDGFRTRVLCKGSDQLGTVRGERFGAYRPDLIIIDDLEDDEMVKNPERRRSLQELYDGALMPSGDVDTQVIAIGTILHDDSLMAKLVSKDEYKEYKKLFFKARYINTKTNKKESVWPEKWSVEVLDELEKMKPETFAKEFQGDPVSGAIRKFDREDFRIWRREEGHYVLYEDSRIIGKGLLSNCRAAIGLDMAWDEKKINDDTVVMPALLTPDSELLVDTYFASKGVKPDQLEEILFAMEEKYKSLTDKPVVIGMEKGKLEKVMKWWLKQSMKRRNHYLITKDIPWVLDKIARIVTVLQPRYKMNSIYHLKGMGDLENQLLRVPSGKHDDLCLVGETKILTDKGNKRLDEMRAGDMVMTRSGYKKVLDSSLTGTKHVIDNIGLTGTPNHPVITTKGIIDLDKVHAYDKLYIWNEKLSYIEEKSITDILRAKEGSIGYIFGGMTNGKNLLSHCIDRFGSIILDKYQKAMSSITKMAILLITNHPILNVCQNQITYACTQPSLQESRPQRSILKLQENIRLNGTKAQKEESGTGNKLLNLLKKEFLSKENVTPEIKPTITTTPRQDFVAQDVASKASHQKRKVYNLTVEDNNEYFANNILVHNCDALQIATRCLQNTPVIKKTQSKPEDPMFENLRESLLIKEHRKPIKNKLRGFPARTSILG